MIHTKRYFTSKTKLPESLIYKFVIKDEQQAFSSSELKSILVFGLADIQSDILAGTQPVIFSLAFCLKLSVYILKICSDFSDFSYFSDSSSILHSTWHIGICSEILSGRLSGSLA